MTFLRCFSQTSTGTVSLPFFFWSFPPTPIITNRPPPSPNFCFSCPELPDLLFCNEIRLDGPLLFAFFAVFPRKEQVPRLLPGLLNLHSGRMRLDRDRVAVRVQDRAHVCGHRPPELRERRPVHGPGQHHRNNRAVLVANAVPIVSLHTHTHVSPPPTTRTRTSRVGFELYSLSKRAGRPNSRI